MSNLNLNPAADFEPLARKSFFVAVCDCGEGEFVASFGCIHPFHVLPGSLIAGSVPSSEIQVTT